MTQHTPEMLRALEAVSRKLADDGKLVEAGWISLRIAAINPDAPQDQLDEMRMAFMAGAQHVFASIMTIMDPGEEPTDGDLRRLDLIDGELRAFIREFELRHIVTRGRA